MLPPIQDLMEKAFISRGRDHTPFPTLIPTFESPSTTFSPAASFKKRLRFILSRPRCYREEVKAVTAALAASLPALLSLDRAWCSLNIPSSDYTFSASVLSEIEKEYY